MCRLCVSASGGLYSKCGARVHEMLHWLDRVQALVGNGRWLLIADWNAHHEEWSLDRRSDPVGKVLEEWRKSRRARILRSRSHTFERQRGDGVVVSRIDFALAGGGAECWGISSGWGLSHHSAIGCVVTVNDMEVVEGCRDAVDRGKVQLTVANEREAWYGELVGATAYNKLVDFRNRHLKKIRICGRSKRWWDAELMEQVRRVRRERRRVSGVGHRNRLRSDILRMKWIVREKKDACWEVFCGDSSLQSPWEVVRWARNPWRERERMGKLKDGRGRWLDADVEMVRCLVSEVFGR